MKQIHPMKESMELKKWIIEMYDHILDPKYFEKALSSSDVLLGIGSDEGEWWEGKETFLKMLEKQAEYGNETGMAVTESNPRVYKEGDIGWWNDQITISVNKDSVKMRTTGVLHKEEGEWKIIQIHFSIGIPNAETAFGDIDLMKD